MIKRLNGWIGLPGLLLSGMLQAASLDQSLQVASDMQQDAARSQQNIDQLALQTEKMLQEYQRLLTDTEYQTEYRNQLQQLQLQQEQEIDSLRAQLESVQYTQQRLQPLLLSMVEALAQFVALDLPFHHAERSSAVSSLKQRLNHLDLALADKLRMVLELFQVEMAYGNSLETYREQISQQRETLAVNCLRIGRLALYYQTLDGSQSALWNRTLKQWQTLPDEYNHAITTGIRIASNQLAPELLAVPMLKPALGEVTP